MSTNENKREFADHYYDPLELVKHLHANIGWAGGVGNFIAVNDELRKRLLACIKPAVPVLRLPEGWTGLSIIYNGDMEYPEEVAYGPERMMNRLGKWLDKHFAREIAERAANSATSEPVAEVNVIDGSTYTKYLQKLPDGKHSLFTASNTATAAPGDLSDERIMQIHDHLFAKVFVPELIDKAIRYARAIEREVLASNAGAAPAPLMRQAVASVGHPVNGMFRINWMRPERLQVGSLLYCVDHAAPSNSPAGAKEQTK